MELFTLKRQHIGCFVVFKNGGKYFVQVAVIAREVKFAAGFLGDSFQQRFIGHIGKSNGLQLNALVFHDCEVFGAMIGSRKFFMIFLSKRVFKLLSFLLITNQLLLILGKPWKK